MALLICAEAGCPQWPVYKVTFSLAWFQVCASSLQPDSKCPLSEVGRWQGRIWIRQKTEAAAGGPVTCTAEGHCRGRGSLASLYCGPSSRNISAVGLSTL